MEGDRACIQREVQARKNAAAKATNNPVAIVSYDKRPGIHAIATTAPALPSKPAVYKTLARAPEYKDYGTVSPFAGIDPDRHRSREFVKRLDGGYLATRLSS